MSEETDRLAQQRERLARQAAAAEQSQRVPGKQSLVERELGPAHPPATGVPGKHTLVEREPRQEGIDVPALVAQAHEALAGTRDRERARAAIEAALTSHWAQIPPEQAGELMSALVELMQPAGKRQPADVAAEGVSAASSTLPFHDEIQASFGRHDVSRIRAQIGGDAAAPSAALGARAYAIGDRVGFAREPDLHTAAHEAAHVVQQRGGVSLKGIDGGASDPYERHADAVADAVVRGESAEPLLDAAPRGGGGEAAVQRKPDLNAAPTTHDDGPQTVKQPHAKWPVFAETGLPYKIVSAKDPVQFWTVSDWIRSSAGFKTDGSTHATAPACAAEILDALGWVAKDRIESASKHIVFDISRRVAPSQVAASAFYYTGLPTSRSVVSRASHDIVEVATRLNDPNVPAGTRVEPDDAQRLEVIRALSTFTGLVATSDALESLRNAPRFQEAVVQSGVIRWDIDEATGNVIFGFDETSNEALPYSRWLHGKNDKKQPQAHESEKPKFKLHNYYGKPIPGELHADRDLVEAAHPIWLEIAVKWPRDYPSPTDYEVVPMVTPGHLGGEASLLHCEWHIELVGGAVAAPPASTGASANASGAGVNAAVNQPQSSRAGAVGPASTSSNALTSAATPALASVSAASSSKVAQTNVSELHHAFVLPHGQESGTFRVMVRASFDEYFEPAEFTTTVDVKSTAAAMNQLGDEAFADVAPQHEARTAESFDASGSGDDNHGSRMSGDLPPTFKPSSLDTPDPRAAARVEQRKRLEATRMYLQTNRASADVLEAIDRELAASRATEAALASDNSKGWQPFQIRGTYLSREDGVPSGPLTLYGSVHSELVPKVSGGTITGMTGEIVVQIRDLSRRFDNEDMTVTGRGTTFEAALKAAFLVNAKAYPTGVMAIEAEAIDAGVANDEAKIGKGNGKTIGFELGTDSRWKRVKAEVFNPVVNVVTNLGAMALMAFVPGSAVIVAPLLVAYNSTPVIDGLRTASEHGTLTLGQAATSVGEIALNLLPLAGTAKAFTTGWFLLEGANWGGQAVLMTASAIQTARVLQGQDVEALAGLYEELQTLEAKPGTDPAAIETKKRQVMERARAVSDRIEEQIEAQITTNGMFAIAGTVIHRAGVMNESGRTELIDSYLKKRGAGGGDQGTNTETGTLATLTTQNASGGGQDQPATPPAGGTSGASSSQRTPEAVHIDRKTEATETSSEATAPVRAQRPTEAEVARKAVLEKYKELTASDFSDVTDPRLQEIAEAARAENEEVQARLRAALEKAGVKDVEIQYRAKSLKSILGKLKETPGAKVKDIKDLSGIRVNITRVNEANFAQYNKIKATIQQEFGIPESAVKDYNKKPNPWGYTGRVHMFEAGGAEIVSEIQVGSKDLSGFIEKRFSMPDGSLIELHDLTGYKGQLYGKAIPPDLQSDYTRLIGKITDVNRGGNNLADVPEAKAEVDAYFERVKSFLEKP